MTAMQLRAAPFLQKPRCATLKTLGAGTLMLWFDLLALSAPELRHQLGR